MDKPNIVTCTAPVNIAVIKYCKYPTYVALCSNLNVRYVAHSNKAKSVSSSIHVFL